MGEYCSRGEEAQSGTNIAYSVSASEGKICYANEPCKANAMEPQEEEHRGSVRTVLKITTGCGSKRKLSDEGNKSNEEEKEKRKERVEELEAQVEELKGREEILNKEYQNLFLRNIDEKEKSRKTAEELNDCVKVLKECIELLKTEKENVLFRESHVGNGEEQEKSRKMEELKSRVTTLQQEKQNLLFRLSEIGAMKLTYKNPNVTDMCDVNRPEKIVDEFSELYNNEWANVHADLRGIHGKTMDYTIKLLLGILKDAYDRCFKTAQEKETELQHAMRSYSGIPDEDNGGLELMEIEEKMWRYRMKKSQVHVTSLQKAIKETYEQDTKKFGCDTVSKFILYIDECVRVCWYMCIQEPRIHLDFGETEGSNNCRNRLDTSKFKTGLKAGVHIDYIVWPAVFRTKGGQLMRKGHAEAI